MIARIKKVELFQTTDGQTFQNGSVANQHEALTSLRQNLRDICDKYAMAKEIDELLSDTRILAEMIVAFKTFEKELQQ